MQFISDGRIINTMSAANEPIATVDDGETFVVKTRGPGISDDVFRKDYSDGNYPKRILSITGPIYVNGCASEDVLEITINHIQLEETGKMWTGQWMGILCDEIEHPYLKQVTVRDRMVIFSENIRFLVRPMIGTLGVAPARKEIPCLYPGDHGANMDVLTISEGSKVYLPVQVAGALLAIGDVHAAMGEGEVFGTGIEIGSEVKLQVKVIKGKTIKHPWIETADSYAVVVSNEDMLEACKEATRSLVSFLEERLDLPFKEAYALVGACADLKICQVVNPIFTVRFEFPKQLLKM